MINIQRYVICNIINCNFCYFQLTAADSRHSGPLPHNNGVPVAQVDLIEQLRQEMLQQIQVQAGKYDKQIKEQTKKYEQQMKEQAEKYDQQIKEIKSKYAYANTNTNTNTNNFIQFLQQTFYGLHIIE